MDYIKEKPLEVKLNAPHENQQKILKSKARYRVVACGRRFGKSEAAKIAANMRLAKGQKIWFCSPTNKNNYRMFRQFERLYKDFPSEYVNINKTHLRIDFVFNGGFIEFVSLAEPDNLRGEGLDFIIIDEAAFVQDHVWDEILSPMLVGTAGKGSGGDALFISSTNGRNWFWRLYQLGLDDNEPDYESFHFTSYDNPLIDHADIDAEKRKKSQHVFEREYMAVFEESGGTVFRNIDRVIRKWEKQENIKKDLADMILEWDGEPKTEQQYIKHMLKRNKNGQCTIIFGIDFARVKDYTVITVFDLNTLSLIEYVRINRVEWEDIREEIKRLNEKWNPIQILAENNDGRTETVELLQKEGLPIEGFRTTSKTKPEIINKLALAIEQQEISLPDDKTLIGELSAYSITQTNFGNIKYTAPNGLHDDIVMSLAIAYKCTDLVFLPSSFEVISV